MKLYQINQSAYPNPIEQDWQRTLNDGDAVILIESGVLRCIQDIDMLNDLTAKGVRIFLRQQDLQTYGLNPKMGDPISDTQWVTLTTQYSKIVSW